MDASGAQGRSARVEALFGQHAGYVAGLGLRLLGRDGEVDDLVQDVFLRAYEALDSLRDPAAVRGWLATIMVRLARRRLKVRRAKSFFWLDAAPDYDTELPVCESGADDQVLLAQVMRALDQVAVDDRLAWTLRRLEGLPLAEVAACCDCSLATVKRRIDAAQAKLQKALSDV